MTPDRHSAPLSTLLQATKAAPRMVAPMTPERLAEVDRLTAERDALLAVANELAELGEVAAVHVECGTWPRSELEEAIEAYWALVRPDGEER